MKLYFSLNKEIHPGRDGELLCDQKGMRSGHCQEPGMCKLIRRAYGSNWLGTVPSPSDWCKTDNISDSMCLVLRHNDSLSDPRNIVRRWVHRVTLQHPGRDRDRDTTSDLITSYTWYPGPGVSVTDMTRTPGSAEWSHIPLQTPL